MLREGDLSAENLLERLSDLENNPRETLAPYKTFAAGGHDSYDAMVDTFAFSAKACWALWGPLGQPMIDGVDRWAERIRG